MTRLATFPRRWTVAVAIGALASLSCGDPTEPSAPASPLREVDPATPSPRYDVHEWGLISLHSTDTTWGTPTPREARPTPIDPLGTGDFGHLNGAAAGKPVLYVHLPDGVDEIRFSAAVAVAGGTIPEHFPPAELVRVPPAAASALESQGVRWDDVVARRGACHGSYPRAHSPGCHTPDGYCERAELADYETDDAACLEYGERRGGLLFYRGAGGRSELPLMVSVEPGSDGDHFRVSRRANDASDEAGEMEMWLVLRGNVRRESRILRVAAPSPGESVLVDRPAPTVGEVPTEESLVRLMAPMREAGMTPTELAAFRRAWDRTLFGRVPPSPDASATSATDTSAHALQRIGDMMEHPLAPQQLTLLYWLPRGAIDEAFPLTLAPQPRAIRRTVLVRVDLSPPPMPTPRHAVELSDWPRATTHPPLRPAPQVEPRGYVRVGPVDVRGSISEEIVRRVVRRHLNELRRCAARTRGGYRANLRMVINSGGAVSAVTMASGDAPPPLARCLIGAVRRWRFPAPHLDGVAVATVPLRLAQDPAHQ